MTTIDNLQIEIQSSSANASQGIQSLAKSLGELKTNGTINVAIKNLNNLRNSLRMFNGVPSSASKIASLASSLEKLKSVGPVGSIGNSLAKLSKALVELDKVNIGNVGPQIQGVADAVAPLSGLKAGGLSTMVNALLKIGKVTKDLDDNKIAAFADRIQRLNAVLEPLSTKMTTIQTGLKGINSSARSAGGGVKQMADDIDAGSVNMASFIYIIQEVVQWLQAAVQKFSEFMAQAIEWDGIAARFGRGFGPEAQETYEWIQRLNEEMGINIQQFMQYSSIYANMLTGFGVVHEDATKMALGYTELTYDIWAGYNDVYKTFEEASEAVKSAIAGEVEPIRRAGFTIIESTLQQTAANHGLNISIEKATEAEKSYLRYLTLVDQAHAQSLVGTYAKELQTAEGLMRTFSQQLKSLAQAFGSLFLPALTAVMPYLQAFVEMLIDAVRWVAALFGIEIQPVDWSGYNSGLGEAAQATENLGGSTQDLGKALDGAGKAAKELKNATLGIDELNVISPPSPTSGSSSGGGSGGGAGGGGSGFDGLDVDSLWDESIFDGIQNEVDEIKAKFEAWLPVLGTITAALAGLGLTSLIVSIGEALAEMNVLQKAMASIAILTIEAALVFILADNYLESGNLLYLIGEALVTATGGYLMFKAWGAGGLALSLGVSIVAQLIALETSLADGTITLSSPETWIQGIFTIFTGALGGLILSKYTAFFPKEGFVIGLAVSASLVLSTIRMGAIESGEIESGSLESWFLELGSVLTAALAGKFLGVALYGAKGGPAGALVGVTAGLALNLVTTISAEGSNFGDDISDWINVGITSAMAGFTGVKLWGMVSPSVKSALKGIIPSIATAVSTALGGLGAAITAVGGGWVVAAAAAIVGILALAIVDYDFTEIGRKIGEKVGEAFRAVADFAKDIGGAFMDGIEAAIDWVVEEFDIDSVWDIVNLLFNPVAWATEILPKMWEIGAEILPGLWEGIEDGWDNFWENIGEFIDGFIQGFRDGFEIKSPSKAFSRIGGLLIDGLWSGINDKFDSIKEKILDWIEKLIEKIDTDALTKPFKDMWNNATEWLEDKDFNFSFTPNVGDIKESLQDKWASARSWWNDKKEALKSYTPSIGDIKKTVEDKWKSARDWWNGRKPAPKTYTPPLGSIYEKLKDRWDSARTWWNNKKSKLKTYTPSIGSIYEPLSTRWKNARDWWNKKKPKLSTLTPAIGSFTDKLRNAWNSAKKWWNKNVRLDTKLNVKVPTIKVNWDTATAFGKSFKYPTGFKLKFAADGGIFDAGSLIWAGERGAEVVANAGGGKTGVMNVNQMSDAVFEGVYAAVMAANRATSGDGSPAFNIYLDGKQITATVEKRQRERGTTIMGNQVYTYG